MVFATHYVLAELHDNESDDDDDDDGSLMLASISVTTGNFVANVQDNNGTTFVNQQSDGNYDNLNTTTKNNHNGTVKTTVTPMYQVHGPKGSNKFTVINETNKTNHVTLQ